MDLTKSNKFNKTRLIWISAVETSADLHGSNLMKNLKMFFPDFGFVGVGGFRMRKEGLCCLYPAEKLSIMGLTEVICFVPKIIWLYRKIFNQLKSKKPDFLILIDAPDFHFKIAKMAWSLKIPVFYYISPQVWAWRKGRIKFLKKYVRKLFCIFPFEKEFFAKHGLDVEYVGHPLVEEIDFKTLSTIKPTDRKVSILPGSRLKEVKLLLPEFYKACLKIKKTHPSATFTLIKAPNISFETVYNLWGKDIPIEVADSEDEKYIRMKECEVAIAASGTATLECGLLGIPCAVAYKVSRLSYVLAKQLVDTKFISMTNIILNEGIYPEFIQNDACGDRIAEVVNRWLGNKIEIEKIKEKLKKLKRIIGDKPASFNCAKLIWESMYEKA